MYPRPRLISIRMLPLDAILQMTGSEHRQALADLLNDLFYCDVDIELRFHLDSMRKVLPKLIEKLEARK